jgi:hypothetical protein
VPNRALHRTAIPLHSIAVGDLGRWTSYEKKRYIISGILLALVIVVALTGGIYIYTGPEYKFDHEYGIEEEGEGFIPKHFILNTRQQLIL